MTLHFKAYSLHDAWWILYKTMYNEMPIRTNKKIGYYNVPCSFDIETTSLDIEEKHATMYVWMVAIKGYCIVGRTWDEFKTLLDKISNYCGLSSDVRLIVYVHNLAYEFQFIKDMFSWIKVFALDNRKPCYCVCENGIEFRCSYILSGYSLDKVSTNLQKHKIRKLIGNLDYTKYRHCSTPLSKEELDYCINDVLVVTAYIQETIESEGNITNVPLTKTGYVRRYCKRCCIGTSKHRNRYYRSMIKRLTLEADEYKQLRYAFMGGFTHANSYYVGKTINNVESYDFTSSYPAVMVSEKFPMSKGKRIQVKDSEHFEYLINRYCCLFDVELFDVCAKEMYENYLSYSHCNGVKDAVINNGRIYYAKHLYTTITDVDYKLIRHMYTYSNIKVANMWIYKKDYLPTEFVKAILKLYSDKTTLKGVTGKETEYMRGKEMLNSCYGMIVTDICRESNIYEHGQWTNEKPDIDKEITKYNNAKSRFLFYPWGIWVTAYARMNLFTGIVECKHDYIYSDTDSIKMINGDGHKEYIEKYNWMITDKLRRAMEYHHLSLELTRPKTIKGEKKPLGVWDYEGHIAKFKTLGAKRYLVLNKQGYELTVSGLNKRIAIKYLMFGNEENKSIFDMFNDNMYIPKGKTGKMIHTYIDEPISGTMIDYLGNISDYSEMSCVHLDNADYSLSIGREFAEFLLGMKDVIV